jgi:hypothetical protein
VSRFRPRGAMREADRSTGEGTCTGMCIYVSRATTLWSTLRVRKGG